MQVFIGIGSNLGDPASNVQGAVDLLAEVSNCELIQYSSLYQSEPLGDIADIRSTNGPRYLDCTTQVPTHPGGNNPHVYWRNPVSVPPTILCAFSLWSAWYPVICAIGGANIRNIIRPRKAVNRNKGLAIVAGSQNPMSAEQVYIGIGSNLGDPASNVQGAVDLLAKVSECELIEYSSLYLSEPLGDIAQTFVAVYCFPGPGEYRYSN